MGICPFYDFDGDFAEEYITTEPIQLKWSLNISKDSIQTL